VIEATYISGFEKRNVALAAERDAEPAPPSGVDSPQRPGGGDGGGGLTALRVPGRAGGVTGAAGRWFTRPERGATFPLMAEATAKDRILDALKDLPRDATFDDAIERLVFLAKIDEGLAQLDAGRGLPHEEVKRRLGL